MIKYFEEADDINIDVQVGPEKEYDVSAAPEEAVPSSPVDEAKKKAENIPIACVPGKDGACCEFYVDAEDVEYYADLTEQTMLEALNSIIAAHEDSEISADNLVVVLGESTVQYARNLERHGAIIDILKEADEQALEDKINIDVQVGPNGEDMEVEADPQEANPVDAVKRQYDNVVVAQKDDKFFVDVEDVQKCADLNCESVIATLNGIISANEASEISADNLVVLVHEGVTSQDTVDVLEQAGAEMGIVREANIYGKRIEKELPGIRKDLKDSYKSASDEDIKKTEKKLEFAEKHPRAQLKAAKKEMDDAGFKSDEKGLGYLINKANNYSKGLMNAEKIRRERDAKKD